MSEDNGKCFTEQNMDFCREIIEFHSDLICKFLPNHRLIYANTAYCEFFGLRSEDINGLDFSYFIPENQRKEVLEPFSELTPEAPENTQTHLVIGSDERESWIEWRNIAAFDENGTPKEIVAIGRDVTDRVEMEKKLRIKSENYRFIVENQSDLVVKVDLNGRFEFVSPSYCEIFGVSESDIIGQNFISLKNEGNNRTFAKIIREICSYPYNTYIEQSALTARGRLCVGWIYTAVLDEEENVITIIGVGRDISKQKQAEKELHESEALLRVVTENARDTIFRMSIPSGQYEFMSAASKDVFGYKPQEFMENPLLIKDIIHPDWEDYFAEEWNKLLVGEMAESYEYQIIHRSGDIRWVNQRNFLEKDEHGNPQAIVGVVNDVTERKISENTIRLEKERAESYLNIAGVMIVALNTKGVITLANRRACEVLGWQQEELIGKNWFDTCLPPDNIDEIKKVAQQIWSGNVEPVKHYVNEVITKSGERRLVAWYNTVYKDLEGHIIGLLSSGDDITDKHIAEQQMRLFSNVIKYSSEAVMITDQEEKVIFVNESFTSITGYSTNEIIGKTPQILISGKHDKTFFEAMWNSLHECGHWHGEITNRQKNGALFTGLTSIDAIYDDDGNLINYVRIISDISQVKQREEKLRRINAELEEFAYVTSHDLREPLRMISAYTGLIEKKYGDAFDEKAREYLDFVQGGAQRMDLLIQDVLTYSRIGRSERAVQPVNMGALLERVMEYLDQAIVEAGAEITIEPALPCPLADERSVERVFSNIISNALKYRQIERPLKIVISGESFEGQAMYSISDNGIGIEKKFQNRIFRMFQRLHSREEYSGGTGIGLAICQKVVEHYGGRLWVQSKPGQGSKFSFTFPLST